MSDEPKYPPHYNAELIDQYETYMRHKKEAPAKEPSLESLDVEQPKVEPPKPEPAKGALPFEPASFNPGDLTQVPGVVGRQTRWIVESALYPQPVLALGSALVTVGVAMSRKVITPTQGGTHLFVVAIGDTGVGKERTSEALKEALTIAGMMNAVCGEIKSAASLNKTLTTQPEICAVLDEYGLLLQRLMRSNAGSSESSLMSDMRTLWGTQFGKMYHTASTLDRPAELIYGPAFSIYALSVQEDVGAAFRATQIVGGFFNRHLYLVAGPRPPKQDPARKMPEELVLLLRALRPKVDLEALKKKAMSAIKSPNDKKDGKDQPKPSSNPITPQVELRWGPGAKAVWDQLDVVVAAEPDRMRRILFTRVPDMTVRLASIVAYGRGSLTVDEPDMLWARAFAMQSAQSMHVAVLKYMEDPKSHNALCEAVLQLLMDAPRLDGGGPRFVSRRDINRACRKFKSKGDDLKAAINQLIAEERIGEHTRSTAGRSSFGYKLVEE